MKQLAVFGALFLLICVLAFVINNVNIKDEKPTLQDSLDVIQYANELLSPETTCEEYPKWMKQKIKANKRDSVIKMLQNPAVRKQMYDKAEICITGYHIGAQDGLEKVKIGRTPDSARYIYYYNYQLNGKENSINLAKRLEVPMYRKLYDSVYSVGLNRAMDAAKRKEAVREMNERLNINGTVNRILNKNIFEILFGK